MEKSKKRFPAGGSSWLDNCETGWNHEVKPVARGLGAAGEVEDIAEVADIRGRADDRRL